MDGAQYGHYRRARNVRFSLCYSQLNALSLTNIRHSYFNRYALSYYTKDPRYAPYINVPLLDKYYPVGGVRIEDDILITETGNENLTTAPKGDEALRIINEGTEPKEGKGEARKRGWFSK